MASESQCGRTIDSTKDYRRAFLAESAGAAASSDVFEGFFSFSFSSWRLVIVMGFALRRNLKSTRPCCPIRTDELRSCSNNANRNRHWRTASRAATADLAAGQLFPLPAECRGVGSQTPALALSRSVRSTASGRVWRVLTENSTGHSC